MNTQKGIYFKINKLLHFINKFNCRTVPPIKLNDLQNYNCVMTFIFENTNKKCCKNAMILFKRETKSPLGGRR